MSQKSSKILFPIKNVTNSLGSSWVEVTKRSSSWYVVHYFNKGMNTDGPTIYKKKADAIRKAESIRRNY